MAQQDKDDRSSEMQTGKEVHPHPPIRLVDTHKTSCYTNASVECQLQSDKDTHVGAQKIAFASDGRRVGITCRSLCLTFSLPEAQLIFFLRGWLGTVQAQMIHSESGTLNPNRPNLQG
jgi:hypothetical protein